MPLPIPTYLPFQPLAGSQTSDLMSESLVGVSVSSAERRDKRGGSVPPGVVRLAVGCVPVEELIAAIKDSLDRLVL